MKTDVIERAQASLDLSIIIVNWNTKNYLDECLDSIYKTTRGIDFEIFVIDNDSKDGSADMVTKKYPDVILIENKTNEGFAKANNKGIKKSKGEFILLLNPDTHLMGEPLVTLVEFMKRNEDVGVCGCKVLNRDGSLEPACRRGIPTPKAALYRFVGLNKIFSNNPKFAKYNLTHLNPHKVTEVDAVSGSFFLVRREIIEKVGLLDENFFLYGEEIDWCYRIKNCGYKVVYNPNAEIIHYKGGSSSQNRLRAFYEFYRSMFVFHEKHFSPQSTLTVNIFVKAGIILRALSIFFLGVGRVICKMALDLAMLTLSFIVAFIIWHFLGLSEAEGIIGLFKNIHFQSYLQVWFIIAVFMLISYSIFGLYERTNFNQTKEELFNLSFKGTSLGMILIIVLNFMSRKFSEWSYPIPRSVFLIWWVLSILAIAAFRILFQSMRKQQKYVGRILLYGEGVEKLHDYFSELGSLKYHVVGVIGDKEAPPGGSCPVVGNVENIDKTIDEYHINEIIIHNRKLSNSELVKIISRTSGRELSIRIIPDYTDFITGDIKIARYAGLPSLLIPLKKPYHWYISIKRGIDIVFSLALLLATGPFSLLLAIYRKVARKGMVERRLTLMGEKGSLFQLKLDPLLHWEEGKGVNACILKRSFIFAPQVLYRILKGDLSFIGARLYFAMSEDVDATVKARGASWGASGRPYICEQYFSPDGLEGPH